jgi:prophage regulatory protein
MTDRFVLDAECKAMTGLSKTTRWKMEQEVDQKGEPLFPRRRQITGGRVVGWLESELLDWMRSRQVGGPSVSAPALAAAAAARAERQAAKQAAKQAAHANPAA